MDPISASAASGMRARMESLDLLANNIANASTGGYKGDREFYSLYVSQDALDAESAGAGSPDNLPVIEKQYTDYSQGTIHATDSPLDFALTGRGFFTVTSPSGPLYTRNGNFRLTSGGVLVTEDGLPVQAKGGGTIQTKSASPLDVSRDGTVVQDGLPIGQMQLAGFEETTQLNKKGVNYFYKIDPKTAPSVSNAEIHQGKLEGSNFGPAESTVRLINVTRQFEMLTKAVTIGADMDKQSLQEVARVNS